MPRSIWKGSIAFGLVQIPVGLYTAEEPDDLSFTLLDRRDFSPIGFERVNRRTGKKVEWEDVVKGYEVDKGEYVVLSKQDFEEANVEATQTIDIIHFADRKSIDPVYYDKPYYLAPDKGGQKAYALLREVLEKSDRVGVAKVVIRTRQHLAALLPRNGVLTLITLRFAHELRDAKGLDVPEEGLKRIGVSKKELDMAETLVEGMVDEFQPKQYHDEYRDDLMALVDRRVKEGEVNTVPEAAPKKKRPQRAQVLDLMSLLKQSVEERSGRSGARQRAKGGPLKARSERAAARKSGSRRARVA